MLFPEFDIAFYILRSCAFIWKTRTLQKHYWTLWELCLESFQIRKEHLLHFIRTAFYLGLKISLSIVWIICWLRLEWPVGITKTQSHLRRINILFLNKDRHEDAEVNFQRSKTSLSNSNVTGINHRDLVRWLPWKGQHSFGCIFTYVRVCSARPSQFHYLVLILIYSEFIGFQDMKLYYHYFT